MTSYFQTYNKLRLDRLQLQLVSKASEFRSLQSRLNSPALQTGHAAAVKQCVFGTMRGESQVTCGDGSTIPIVEGMVPTVEPPPTQTQIEVLPITSANDNWSGVLIVPIAESALPTTTYLIQDPASAPSTVVAESKPLPTSSLNQSEPLGASASTPAAHPVSIVEPTVSLPGPSSSSAATRCLPH
ncbi:hypothetical protein E4U54_006088 [Claviceps lovelessii]|nr:hypothetical protein E4U54_006088 [Claviceps lovelessii]